MPHLAEGALAGTPQAAGRGPQIALFIDKFEWHAREMMRAFGKLGARCVPMRLSACSFDTRRPSGLVVPGFGPHLPDLVLVRAVGLGSFEVDHSAARASARHDRPGRARDQFGAQHRMLR